MLKKTPRKCHIDGNNIVCCRPFIKYVTCNPIKLNVEKNVKSNTNPLKLDHGDKLQKSCWL